MRVGIASDHGGFDLKQELIGQLHRAGHEIIDFGANSLRQDDDYPDFVLPLGRAVAAARSSVASRSAAAALAHRSVPTRYPASAPR